MLNGATVQLYGKLFAACARAVVVGLGAAHATGLLHGETPQERFAFFVDCLRDTSFLAGMGLALLKLAESARIPNVLILEPASAG
jgi:hypothetical protein